MSIEFIYPEFEVIRNENRCITCRICQQQCANGVHSYNSETKQMVCDESNCVNCQRCVSFCPTRALKTLKSDCSLRENANWSENMMKEIYKQANSGGVLLSSMGNPNPLPVYWGSHLNHVSQVTNPPIDPLRELMENPDLSWKETGTSASDGGRFFRLSFPAAGTLYAGHVLRHELWLYQL